MTISSDELYDWISSNWNNKANYIEGNGKPTTPSPTNFAIYNDTTNKMIYTWDALSNSWKEGLGGGNGQSFEGVVITNNDPITLETNKSYILNSSDIAGKIMTIDLTTFNEIGQELKITDNGYIKTDCTVTIATANGVTVNESSEDIVIDTQNMMGTIMCTNIVRDGDGNITSIACQAHAYGTSSQVLSEPVEYVSETTTITTKKYMTDTSYGSFTLIVGSGFEKGQEFSVWDYMEGAMQYPVTIDFKTNGYKLDSKDDNFILDYDGYYITFLYTGKEQGFMPLRNQF